MRLKTVAPLTVALALAGLSGCSVVKPPLLDERLAVFQSVEAALPALTSADWWEALGDETLNGLVREALEHNFTVQAAAVRLEEARGQDKATIWTLLPTGSASEQTSNTRVRNYRQNGFSLSSPPKSGTSTSTSTFAVSWELPLFGKANAISDQGTAQQRQSYWNLEAAKLALSSEIVRSYAELRGTQAASRSLAQSVRLLEALVQAEETVKLAGVSTQAEVNRLRSRLVDQQSELTNSRGQEQQLIAKLDALLGQASGAEALLSQTPAKAAHALPEVAALRADALRLRPDVHVAEENVALAAARAGIALANLWPQFTLGGELSVSSGNLDSTGLTRGHSDILSTNAGLKIPLLDWFALKADADAKQQELNAVTMDYRQAVVSGWEEARSAFTDYAVARERLGHAQESLALAKQEQVRQAAFWAAGVGTKQTQLEADLAVADKEISLASQRYAGLQAWSKLVKATFAAPNLPKPKSSEPRLSVEVGGG